MSMDERLAFDERQAKLIAFFFFPWQLSGSNELILRRDESIELLACYQVCLMRRLGGLKASQVISSSVFFNFCNPPVTIFTLGYTTVTSCVFIKARIVAINASSDRP